MISVLAASCTGTHLVDSWVEPGHAKPYKYPMIIGVSDSQQTRQLFEKYFVAQLKKKNISATPSFILIDSKQKMNRETVVKALADTDIPIDSVIATYLVAAETEVKHHDSPLANTYADSADDIRISATIVSTRGRTSDTEIFFLKTDLYDAQSKTIVWSAQTKTVAPESIDEVIENVVVLLIDKMMSDGILK
ncbi:MAG: hypothetical protein RQ982_02970 [Gammaproteobacteria bacterium]|nr:hypothetical protein [Gammaproteobacteria bacterium]